MSIADRLRRVVSPRGIEPAPAASREAPRLAPPVESLARARRESNEHGSFWIREELYGLEHLHGRYPLEAPLLGGERELGLFARDRRLESFDLRRALFLDTETTGLSGGTGTVAFLVGCGFYEAEGFRVQQLFMSDFDEEPALLAHLSGLMARSSGFVTYNGKSFDLPLLAGRFVANRIRPPELTLPHLDLLHMGRRLWRWDLPGLTLGEVERGLLGVTRVGDVGGALIPELYFRFLTERLFSRIEPVLTHNSIDLLSLVSILAAGTRVCRGESERGGEWLGLARNLETLRQRPEAVRAYRAALERTNEPALERQIRKGLARALARTGEYEAAASEWMALLSRFEDLDALEALAKGAEHRLRNPRLATELVDRALARLASPLFRSVRTHDRRRQALVARRLRLTARLSGA